MQPRNLPRRFFKLGSLEGSRVWTTFVAGEPCALAVVVAGTAGVCGRAIVEAPAVEDDFVEATAGGRF